MSADITVPHLKLSPAYRLAQRSLAQWLEDAPPHAPRFVLRAAWARLAPTEQQRMARWLAWQFVAASDRHDRQLTSRMQKLDADLASAITRAARQLPSLEQPAYNQQRRLSA